MTGVRHVSVTLAESCRTVGVPHYSTSLTPDHYITPIQTQFVEPATPVRRPPDVHEYRDKPDAGWPRLSANNPAVPLIGAWIMAYVIQPILWYNTLCDTHSENRGT